MRKRAGAALLALGCLLTSCAPKEGPAAMRTQQILVTSEAGDILAEKENVEFRQGRATGTRIEVFPERLRQRIEGIGSSFTESSAYVLAHLDPAKRRELMRRIYGQDGANFSLARTPIAACDFSVEGRWSYDDVPGDTALEHFSVERDRRGFDPAEHPGVKDPSFDLLPMIREALAIKAAQEDSDLRIVASAWTAPAWMKDIEDWYRPASAENGWQGTGGSLKPEFEQTYADYLIRYLDAYAAEGVPIWGLTPVNEPHGNNGSWESMHFSPESQNEFIKRLLGPALKAGRHADTRLLVYDQNRDGMEKWADAILADPETAPHVHGMAIHWYESTFKVYEDAMDRVHEKYPDFAVMHTEGCIDDLGKEAPEGIGDPEGFKESGWFLNDDFWWNRNATDWGYTAPWATPTAEDHPMYTPVHRYARNIIVSLDHWMTGWIDWNVVLDSRGGPNHVGNFCGAPIMIDRESGDIHTTPVFHVLAQLSRTIRPGDRAVETRRELGGLGEDDLHACATLNEAGLLSVQLLNTTKQPMEMSLQIGGLHAEIHLPANCVQTLRVQL